MREEANDRVGGDLQASPISEGPAPKEGPSPPTEESSQTNHSQQPNKTGTAFPHHQAQGTSAKKCR